MGIKGKVFEYWKDSKYVIDWGEPSCWACHRPVFSPLEDNLQYYSQKNLFSKIWDTTEGLEVCHIVARSLGGGNEPSNLFLLCPECHERSPDTSDRDIFLEWVDNKFDFISDKNSYLAVALNSFNLSDDDMYRLSNLFTYDTGNIMDYVSNNITTHRGGNLKNFYTNLVGAAISYMRKIEKGEEDDRD